MNTDFDEATWVAERLPEVDDPDGITTDRARVALLEHISAAPAPRRRRLRLRLAAVGVGTAAVAVGGAIAIGNAPRQRAAIPRFKVAIVTRHHRGGRHLVLVRLADDITQAPAPPGNATLVFRHHTFPNQSSFSGYDLYEDNGDYYYGATLDELHQALADPSSGDTQLGGILTAAARSASMSPAEAANTIYQASPAPSGVSTDTTGLKTALEKELAVNAGSSEIAAIRRRLAEISSATPAVAQRLATPDQATIDNYLWMNCMDALEGGAGRADIRAGAMLALSTLPDVQIEQTTLDGEQVVKITNTQFSDSYAETLDLDAQTGVLVRMSGGTVGQPDSVDVTYQVTRVSAPSLDPAARRSKDQ